MASDQFYQKYGLTIFFFASLLLVIFMLRPFLKTILIALVVGYAFLPMHEWIFKRIKYANIASGISVSIVFLALFIPLLILLGTVVSQTRNAYQFIININQYLQQNAVLISDFIAQYTSYTLDTSTVIS